MKYYAQIDTPDSIKSVGKGSNEKLAIRLSQGNNNVAQITFVSDFIEIWTKDDTGDHYWNYKFQLKGKKQNDKQKCKQDGCNNLTKDGFCNDCLPF